MKITAFLLALCIFTGCDKNATLGMNQTDPTPTPPIAGQLSYLALGDSYTIGEAVARADCFPFQLAASMRQQGLAVAAPSIVAKTGWTTAELQAGIKSDGVNGRFDMVTLLIGVNNQYRGYAIDTYRTEFRALLQAAIGFAGGNKAHVFVVSIPDWGATPFGQGSGKSVQDIAREIDSFNRINKEETLNAGVSYTDITPGSRNATTDPALVASDGLHPSGKMYAEWVKALISPVVATYR